MPRPTVPQPYTLSRNADSPPTAETQEPSAQVRQQLVEVSDTPAAPVSQLSGVGLGRGYQVTRRRGRGSVERRM